jgi:hypothetical protein
LWNRVGLCETAGDISLFSGAGLSRELYQAEYDLRVTGQVDAVTLDALSVPMQKSSATKNEGPLFRAKLSQ